MSTLHWIAIGILYPIIGYQIGKLSLEVYDKWDRKDDSTAGTFIGMRLLFFPMRSFDRMWTGDLDLGWGFVGVARENHNEGLYLLLNTTLWPIRLVWFALIIVVVMVFAVLAPPLILAWRISKDAFLSLVRIFTNSPLPTTTSSETEKS